MLWRMWVITLIVVIAVTLTACSGRELSTAAPNSPPVVDADAEIPETDVAVYYLRSDGRPHLVREVHSIRVSDDVFLAAVRELTDGVPTTPGTQVGFPHEISCLGVQVDGHRADVRFSKDLVMAGSNDETLTLAVIALVNTLTEFKTIEQVCLRANGVGQVDLELWLTALGFQGQPLKRDLSMVLEPAIWVEHPEPNGIVTNPVLVRGSALVDGGVVEVRLASEAGEILAETFTETSKKRPERGNFDTEIVFTSPGGGRGFLEVFHTELTSGEERDKVIIPVVFENNGKFTAGP
ncbi:MAG: GerMN domain-containing protein [Clostridia bacterium]|nr:GerMN domain-containing protein [Clostridia bacterium]